MAPSPSSLALMINSREKLTGADQELIVGTLQHQCRFSRSERGAPLDGIGLALENDLPTRRKLFQPLVIPLWIDLFHDWGS